MEIENEMKKLEIEKEKISNEYSVTMKESSITGNKEIEKLQSQIDEYKSKNKEKENELEKMNERITELEKENDELRENKEKAEELDKTKEKLNVLLIYI